MTCIKWLVILLLSSVIPGRAQTPASELARVLRDKQIITPAEFDRVNGAGTESVQQLAAILRDKGLITAAEAADLHALPPPVSQAPTATIAAAPIAAPEAKVKV